VYAGIHTSSFIHFDLELLEQSIQANEEKHKKGATCQKKSRTYPSESWEKHMLSGIVVVVRLLHE
jgi:hypothetical protein